LWKHTANATSGLFGRTPSTNFPAQRSRITRTLLSQVKPIREQRAPQPIRKTPLAACRALRSYQITTKAVKEADSDFSDAEHSSPVRSLPAEVSYEFQHVPSYNDNPLYTTSLSPYGSAPQVSNECRNVSFSVSDVNAEVGDDNNGISYIRKQKQLRSGSLYRDEQIKSLQKICNDQDIRNASHLIEIAKLKAKVNSLVSEQFALKEQITRSHSEAHDLRITESYHQGKIKKFNSFMSKSQQELSLVHKGSPSIQEKYNRLRMDYDRLKTEFVAIVSRPETGSPTSKTFTATKQAVEDCDKANRLTSQLNILQKNSSRKQRDYASELRSLKSTIEQRETQICQQKSRLAAQHIQILQLQAQLAQIQPQSSATSMTATAAQTQAWAGQTVELKEKYDILYAAAAVVAKEGEFLASGEFGAVGIALEKLKNLLRD
jgi:hypothetical protein